MFILPSFVVSRPRGTLNISHFYGGETIPPLALYAFMAIDHLVHGAYRYEFTTYFMRLLPDLKFRIRDLNIMLVNICDFLTNRRRENKVHLR
jgi:hypothetical protein